jgi:hypothetical protein
VSGGRWEIRGPSGRGHATRGAEAPSGDLSRRRTREADAARSGGFADVDGSRAASAPCAGNQLEAFAPATPAIPPPRRGMRGEAPVRWETGEVRFSGASWMQHHARTSRTMINQDDVRCSGGDRPAPAADAPARSRAGRHERASERAFMIELQSFAAGESPARMGTATGTRTPATGSSPPMRA